MAIYEQAFETEVFVNEAGGYTIKQVGYMGEEMIVALSLDQAFWLVKELTKLLDGGE